MKRLDRYLIGELIVPFLIGTVAVVLMFLANDLIAEFKNIALQHVPPLAVGQLLLFKIPAFLVETLPVGALLASSLAFTRLTRESELTAIRGSGVSILRMVAPVAAFGLVVGLFNYWVAEKVTPPSEKAFRSIATKVGILAGAPNFASNRAIELRDGLLSVQTVTRDEKDAVILINVLLIERPRPGETTLITSDRGEYDKGLFTFHNCRLWAFKGDGLIYARPEKSLTINERIVVPDLFLPPTAESETADQLLAAIRAAKQVGGNSNELQVAYYERFAVPAACLIFAFVAPILSITFARTGAFVGVLLSILLIFLYYNVFVISTSILGRDGTFPPMLAAWFPNLLFLAIGAIALRRLE